jgi:dTMP kinase
MLIAFEGLDQSGKATQARRLSTRLENEGRRVHLISFPDYTTPIGQEIARALAGERAFGPDVMQLLYIANRFEYKPRLDTWLSSGDVVVCDRFRASSVAYGEAQGLDPIWLDETQRLLPTPAITLFLDIPPEAGVTRKAANRDVYERDLALLARVRESYRRQAERGGWVVIDATPDREDVTAAVELAVLPRLVPPSARERFSPPR